MSKAIRQLFRYDDVKDECKNAFVTFLKIMFQLHIPVLRTNMGPNIWPLIL